MIVVADSGASKTTWFLYDKSMQEPVILQSNGLNPYFITAQKIAEAVQQTMKSNSVDTSLVNELFFYGAGLGSSKNRQIIQDAVHSVFSYAQIEIFSDLCGSARALFGNSMGLAAILGTGANAGLYDGKKIIQTSVSIGFILGDEGSGAYTGKTFLQAYFKQQLPSELMLGFQEYSKLELSEILDKVYCQPSPSRFLGSICYFLYENKTHPWVQNHITQSFRAFFTEIILPLNLAKQLPIGFTGSFAAGFPNELKKVVLEYEFVDCKIIADPALKLFEYHSGQEI
jgi:hypothetical protein